MSLRSKARFGAIGIVGLLLGVGDILIHRARHAMGKVAYLASEAKTFDLLYAPGSRVVRSLIFGLVMAAVVLGLYEAIVAGLSAAFRSKTNEDVATLVGGA